jgi:hypothetical protein
MPLDVGLRAILEPEFDEKKMDDEVEDLEERLEALQGVDVDIDSERMSEMASDAETINEQFDGNLGEAIAGGLGGRAGMLAKGGQRLMGAGASGGGGGGGLAAAMGGGAAGSGAAAAGGALVGVALGGAVSIGILKGVQKMASWAPRGRKMVDMFSTAMDLFFRPFGDVIGEALMPYAKGALQAMSKFNRVFQNEGLGVAIVSLAGSVKDALTTDVGAGAAVGAGAGALAGGAIGSAVAPGIGTAIGAGAGAMIGGTTGGLLGGLIDWEELISSPDFADIIRSFEWDDFIDSLKWENWLNPLNWGDAVDGLDWGLFIDLLQWAAWLNPITWATYVPLVIWDDFVNDMGWSEWLSPLHWWDWLTSVDWGEWLNPLNWGGWLDNLTWSTWVDGLNWGAFIPEIDWGDFISGGGILNNFAQGGVISSETIFRAGEGGDSEAIIPLSRLDSMLDRERAGGFREASAAAEPTENNSRGSDLSSLENQLESLLRAVREMSGETSVEVDGQTLVKQERKSSKQYSDSREVYQ